MWDVEIFLVVYATIGGCWFLGCYQGLLLPSTEMS